MLSDEENQKFEDLKNALLSEDTRWETELTSDRIVARYTNIAFLFGTLTLVSFVLIVVFLAFNPWLSFAAYLVTALFIFLSFRYARKAVSWGAWTTKFSLTEALTALRKRMRS